MKYTNGALYGVLGLILAHPAYADLSCQREYSCTELGYSNTEACPTGSFITCPFDDTYKKCIPAKPDCSALGFTNTDKSSWCSEDKLVHCPTDASYTLCDWHSFEEGCGAKSYFAIDEDLLCTDGFVDVSLSDGSTVTCAVECYSSCSTAGYGRDITDVSSDVYCTGGTRTLYRHINDNIEDSTSVVCGKDCHQVYSTCGAAGLNDASECDVHGSGTKIYTSTKGDSIVCYDDSSCSAYQSCGDVNASYENSIPSGKSCKSTSITSVTGKVLKCYYDCKAVTSDRGCAERLEDCLRSCPSDERSADCAAHCHIQYNCSSAYLMFDDLAKIKLASVSEEFAKEKYVNALEFNEEDCTVYDS